MFYIIARRTLSGPLGITPPKCSGWGRGWAKPSYSWTQMHTYATEKCWKCGEKVHVTAFQPVSVHVCIRQPVTEHVPLKTHLFGHERQPAPLWRLCNSGAGYKPNVMNYLLTFISWKSHHVEAVYVVTAVEVDVSCDGKHYYDPHDWWNAGDAFSLPCLTTTHLGIWK